MDGTATKGKPGFTEFVTLMALMISLVALSIDAMLPALAVIGADLNAGSGNESQLVIGVLFAGLALGQLLYGPLSDAWGRKPAIYLGYSLFIVGCLIALFAHNFEQMLAGRFLQGFGVAGPRVVSLALVRDRYQGRVMARVISFVMTIFILVPMIAPAFGQALLQIAHWRAIFVSFLLIALITVVWFSQRLPETLEPKRRRALSYPLLQSGLRTVLAERITLGYTLAAGLIFGAFVGYLSSAAAVFQELYQVGHLFPLYFGVLGLSMGAATLSNTYLVMRFGMSRLCHCALWAIIALSCIYLLVVWLCSGTPPLWSWMVYLQLTFLALGLLFGNLNAQAMEPLGHIAGMGAAVVGSLSTLISVPLGVLVGQSFNLTLWPLVTGFSVLSSLALLCLLWAERPLPKRCDDVGV